MKFYKATSFVFPRHYPARMFILCFGAVHIPLVTFLVLEAVRGHWDWTIFVALLVATIIGSIAAIWGLWGLLAPVSEATLALRALRDGDFTRTVPVGGTDMAGELLESVAHAVRSTAERTQDLQGMASTDLLTGLANRRGFMEGVARLDADSGTLALLDGNRFKRVNDLHGHAEGDRVLRAMADRIVQTVGRDSVVGRWGGDEFVVFFPGTGPVEATFRIEKLRRTMRNRPIALVDGQPVSLAFGLAEAGTDGAIDIDAAVARADTALYADKHLHRATIDA